MTEGVWLITVPIGAAHGTWRKSGRPHNLQVETTLMQGHVRNGGWRWGMGRRKMIQQGLGVVVVGTTGRCFIQSPDGYGMRT